MLKPVSKQLRTAFAVALLLIATWAVAQETTRTHPETYTVRRGDTLWGIAKRFLEKPWLWPEIWQANPQVQNPHLIYPGDVLSLSYLDRVGPQLSLEPGDRSGDPITGILLSEIEPFLKDLAVVDDFKHLPHVVALEDMRPRGSAGQQVYVRGLENTDAWPGQRYMVLRPTVSYSQPRPGRDLDRYGEVIRNEGNLWSHYLVMSRGRAALGHELRRVAAGEITQVANTSREVSVLQLDWDRGGLEVRVGDRLIPEPEPYQPYDLEFFPHPPSDLALESEVRILAVADAFVFGSQNSVIALSGGAREGIDNGAVFSIWENENHIIDPLARRSLQEVDSALHGGPGRMLVPGNYVGHAMVFRTMEKISYALVMESERPAKLGYRALHPDLQ